MMILFLEQARGRPTWLVLAGDLVPAGTTLVTPDVACFTRLANLRNYGNTYTVGVG